VLAGYEVRTVPPKSRSGARTLPLDDALAAALKALKTRQAAERLAAGEAYERGGYVAADELGRPVHPEWYTDEFHRVSDRAGVRRIRLHESRHTALTLMEHAGGAGVDPRRVGRALLGCVHHEPVRPRQP
jgi:integrase